MSNARYFLLLFAVIWAPQMSRTEAAIGALLVLGYALADLLIFIGRRMRGGSRSE